MPPDFARLLVTNWPSHGAIVDQISWFMKAKVYYFSWMDGGMSMKLSKLSSCRFVQESAELLVDNRLALVVELFPHPSGWGC